MTNTEFDTTISITARSINQHARSTPGLGLQGAIMIKTAEDVDHYIEAMKANLRDLYNRLEKAEETIRRDARERAAVGSFINRAINGE